jgi:acetate kinase
MSLLVFNSGSSSLKFQLFDVLEKHQLKSLVRGKVSALGTQAHCAWTMSGVDHHVHGVICDHQQAAEWVMSCLQDLDLARAVTAIGHRIVHGGDEFSAPVRLSDTVINDIDSLSVLAPLHNPLAVQVIRACRNFFSHTLPQIAVFDTAFFHGLPDTARYYALPEQWTREHGIKRYGFHGIAHRALYERCHEMTPPNRKISRVITVQLGQGCSIAAIHNGVPVETSMGFTPLEGLIMGTRSGDVDAGVLLYLMDKMKSEELNAGLYQQAGLLGLSGVSADMAELLALEAQHHPGATRAIAAFCHRVRKYIGAYLAVLGGADAIVFGGGISENAPGLCARICGNMEWCGLKINHKFKKSACHSELCLSASTSKIAVDVVAVDEELLIARELTRFI